MIIIDLFYSILLIGSGYLILRYRKVVKSWTGSFLWAERYLGSGGTYLVLIFFGLFLIFWGFLYPFGGLEVIFGVSTESPNTFMKE